MFEYQISIFQEFLDTPILTGELHGKLMSSDKEVSRKMQN